MKRVNYTYPKSSFLSMDKDLGLIINSILANDRLKKMLYYTTSDCLSKPKLTEDESLSLFGKNIKIVPKLSVDEESLIYLVISFDNFMTNRKNPEFRDNIIEFDIICNYDQWHLKDFELRPYKIAAEIDSMFNNKHLTGIGTLKFLVATQQPMTDSLGGICLLYQAVHGEEDKVGTLNPIEQKDLDENFDNIFNVE